MPAIGDTKTVDGRTLQYTKSSVSPNTYYWRTMPTNAPRASREEIQTRNLASQARQAGGADAATRVYQAAGYTGTPQVSTRPTTFNIDAARAAMPVSPVTTPSTGTYAGTDIGTGAGASITGGSQADLTSATPQNLQQMLLAEIQGNQPASFADALTQKVNEKLQESTKGLESLRGDIIAGQAQRLTTPDQFIMGAGYSPAQIRQLKQPEELGARARLAALDDRIAQRQSQIDKAIDAVGKMEGERRNTNIKLLQTMIEQQRYDQEQADAAKQAERAYKLQMANLALNIPEGKTGADLGLEGDLAGIKGAQPLKPTIHWEGGQAYRENPDGSITKLDLGTMPQPGEQTFTTGGASNGAGDPDPYIQMNTQYDIVQGYNKPSDYGAILDDNGQPVARITSTYGADHSTISGEKHHNGMDVVFNNGMVKALADSKIVNAGFDKAYGGYVWLQDQQGNTLQYAHMDRDDVNSLWDFNTKQPKQNYTTTNLPAGFIPKGAVIGSNETNPKLWGAGNAPHTDIRYITPQGTGQTSNTSGLSPQVFKDMVTFSTATNTEKTKILNKYQPGSPEFAQLSAANEGDYTSILPPEQSKYTEAQRTILMKKGQWNAAAPKIVGGLAQKLVNGKVDDVKGEVRTNLITSLPSAQQDFYKNGQIMLKDLATLKNAFDAASQTGIVAGNIQQLKEKLGMTGDPQLAALGAQVDRIIQTYTKAQSGAAFSYQEFDRYAKLFGGVKNAKELNLIRLSQMGAKLAQDMDLTTKDASGGYVSYNDLIPTNELSIYGLGQSSNSQQDSLRSKYNY